MGRKGFYDVQGNGKLIYYFFLIGSYLFELGNRRFIETTFPFFSKLGVCF